VSSCFSSSRARPLWRRWISCRTEESGSERVRARRFSSFTGICTELTETLSKRHGQPGNTMYDHPCSSGDLRYRVQCNPAEPICTQVHPVLRPISTEYWCGCSQGGRVLRRSLFLDSGTRIVMCSRRDNILTVLFRPLLPMSTASLCHGRSY
jgi:hypothetical protein